MLLFSKFERYEKSSDKEFSERQGRWVSTGKVYLLNKSVRVDHVFSIEKKEKTILINDKIFSCQADERKYGRYWTYDNENDCNEDYELIKKQLNKFS